MGDTEKKAAKLGILGKYAYAWITLVFFAESFALHWWFGWRAFVDEAHQHGQAPVISEYLTTSLLPTWLCGTNAERTSMLRWRCGASPDLDH